jgi:hypothetical protein
MRHTEIKIEKKNEQIQQALEKIQTASVIIEILKKRGENVFEKIVDKMPPNVMKTIQKLSKSPIQ